MGDTVSFNINAVAVAGNGKITAIRVQDVATHVWYNWDNGAWSTPVPTITPGAGNLYIAAYTTNNGGPSSLTLTIAQTGYGLLASKTQSIGNGESFGLEFTGDMPYAAIQISIAVTP